MLHCRPQLSLKNVLHELQFSQIRTGTRRVRTLVEASAMLCKVENCTVTEQFTYKVQYALILNTLNGFTVGMSIMWILSMLIVISDI